MKRIVICADGTWNRPEEDVEKDHSTNVLKVARAIRPVASDEVEQVVFYDWGLGSYHDGVSAGAFGDGINKNIQDCYRFIVQNYALGDELYFFGFSRGAFTVRSLAGFINNCGILRQSKAKLIPKAFGIYKDTDIHPDDEFSVEFRRKNSTRSKVAELSAEERGAYTNDGSPKVHFIGVWDTVGALGVPLSVLSFLNRKHMFHDNKIGSNIRYARHALAIDERRDDFKPTIWVQKPGVDIEQVWFAGCHSDVGGGLAPDPDGRTRLSDIPLKWVTDEASAVGLEFSGHLGSQLKPSATSRLNESYKNHWLLAGEHKRALGRFRIHASVRDRWDNDAGYRPDKLVQRVNGAVGWGDLVGE